MDKLLDVNFDPDTPPNAMENSHAFGRRLRAWQALCVLARLLPRRTLDSVTQKYWRALQHLNVHTIRFYMDLFGMLLCRRFPDVMLTQLLTEIAKENQGSAHDLIGCHRWLHDRGTQGPAAVAG